MRRHAIRTGRYYLASFVGLTLVVMCLRMLMFSVPVTPKDLMDSALSALLFTVPFVTLEALLHRFRASRARK